MKTVLFPLFASILLLGSGAAAAQTPDYHPVLSDRFILTVGAFRSSNSFKISADGNRQTRSDVDFGDTVGVSDTSTLVNAQLRWKFGSEKKWSLWGQYFSNNATGDATLTEDVDWNDLTFKEGTYVAAGVKLAIARVFVGRSFVLNDQNDFGVGIGIHNLDLSAFIEGEVIIDDQTTGTRRGDVKGSQILPNIGAWYNFSPASRWLLHARVDWISADIGNYDGTLWNTSAGVNFQAWDHVGFDLSWQYFNLNLNVDKRDWNGGADMTYNGPVFSVTANW